MLPLGNQTSSATTVTEPSGSMRNRTVGATSPLPMRSKPKLPSQARPASSTTMSLGCPPTNSLTSAWTTEVPSARAA